MSIEGEIKGGVIKPEETEVVDQPAKEIDIEPDYTEHAPTPEPTVEDEVAPVLDPLEQAALASVAAVEISPEMMDKSEEPAPTFTAKKIKRPDVQHTIKFKRPILTPAKHGDDEPALYGWGGTSDVMSTVIQRVAAKMDRGTSPTDTEIYATVAHQDMVTSEGNNDFQYFKDATWEPHAETAGRLVPNLYRIKNPVAGAAAYTGKFAVQLIKNRMGTGANIGVALWHSGMYCSITAPDDSSRLALIGEIARNRLQALRNTSGILFGNSSYYINRALVNCFLDHLTDCNIVNWDREVVRARLDHRDLQAMAWALLYAIYPDGYNYTQLCGAVDEKTNNICSATAEFKLDFGVALLVDDTRLTTYQLNMMSETFKPHSIAQLDRYREEGVIGGSKAFEITDGIKFVLQGPTLISHIEQGHAWIDSLSKITDDVIGLAADEDERNEYIARQINSTKLREYAHWVKEIIIDDEVTLTDRVKINEILNSFTTNEAAVTKLSAALDEYQRECIVQMVAIPRIPCTECGGIDEEGAIDHPHLIPQDAVSRFFTLARLKL